MRRYWLHRISTEHTVSHKLLTNGYLTLGWSQFSKTGILDASREDTTAHFNEICKSQECDTIRSRWSMWYFAQFSKDDIVVVPTARGNFSICKVLEPAKPIGSFQEEIKEFTDDSGKLISWKNNMLVRGSEDIDLGFAIKVEIIRIDISRSQFADGALTARMKMRQTNGEITNRELCESVDRASKLEMPINFYDEAIKSAEALLDPINKLKPDQFERLILAYMKKIGADDAYIPAKNEHGKTGIADADVVAVFNALKIAVLIQVKHHQGKTDQYAIKQITDYAQQLKDTDSELHYDYDEDYQIIPWVITSADGFDDSAIKMAKEKEVRLIAVTEFTQMLIDVGMSSFNI